MAKENPRLVEGEKERPLLGLKDHGKIAAFCSSCKTALVEFWVTQTNEELIAKGDKSITNTAIVKCDICGGKSFVVTIEGDFYTGAAADDIGFEPLDEEMLNVDHVFRAWQK